MRTRAMVSETLISRESAWTADGSGGGATVQRYSRFNVILVPDCTTSGWKKNCASVSRILYLRRRTTRCRRDCNHLSLVPSGFKRNQATYPSRFFPPKRKESSGQLSPGRIPVHWDPVGKRDIHGLAPSRVCRVPERTCVRAGILLGPPSLLPGRWALTPPFHPYPACGGTVCFL